MPNISFDITVTIKAKSEREAYDILWGLLMGRVQNLFCDGYAEHVTEDYFNHDSCVPTRST